MNMIHCHLDPAHIFNGVLRLSTPVHYYILGKYGGAWCQVVFPFSSRAMYGMLPRS